MPRQARRVCECQWDDHFDKGSGHHAYKARIAGVQPVNVQLGITVPKCPACREHHTMEAMLAKLNRRSA